MEIDYTPQERLNRIVEILAEGVLILSGCICFMTIPFIRVVDMIKGIHFITDDIDYIKTEYIGAVHK